MIRTIFITSILFLLLTTLSCEKKDTEEDEKPKTPVVTQNTSKIPNDAFHGFKKGKEYPFDKNFHKGTFLQEQVGLQKPKEDTDFASNTPDELIKKFSAVLIKNPNDAMAWVMVGNGYSLKGDYDSAIAKYKKAIAIEELPDAYSNMGFSYFHKKDYEDALNSHKEAIALDQTFANSYYGLALIYENRRDLKNSLESWNNYIKYANPNSKWMDAAIKRVEILKKVSR